VELASGVSSHRPTKRSLCPCSETDVLPSPWTDLGGDTLEREEGRPNGHEDPCGKTHFAPVNRHQHDMVEAGEAVWLRLRLTNTLMAAREEGAHGRGSYRAVGTRQHEVARGPA
jgi:hypothetical protein